MSVFISGPRNAGWVLFCYRCLENPLAFRTVHVNTMRPLPLSSLGDGAQRLFLLLPFIPLFSKNSSVLSDLHSSYQPNDFFHLQLNCAFINLYNIIKMFFFFCLPINNLRDSKFIHMLLVENLQCTEMQREENENHL